MVTGFTNQKLALRVICSIDHKINVGYQAVDVACSYIFDYDVILIIRIDQGKMVTCGESFGLFFCSVILIK